ncbi:uncharacterized protein LOC117210858 [Bombus bifarius]|uniref:Uncharacterized protein LOC117210858 n=1 Tax=Bombus bifarius TaxID=103933 RepID=A0A6P8N692_9HYME|nr:uncharacterized protein LOC117210858 [Bombus bifarius]
MQVYATLLAFAVILVVSIESRPIGLNLYVNDHQNPSEVISVYPQLLQYQNSPFYYQNVPVDVNGIPAAVVAYGKPSVSHLPAYNIFYSTPVHDFRFPLNPVYPLLKPIQPGEPPKPSTPSTTTMKPEVESTEDGIEKLDTKVEPGKEMKKSNESGEDNDDDSITIESI